MGGFRQYLHAPCTTAVPKSWTPSAKKGHGHNKDGKREHDMSGDCPFSQQLWHTRSDSRGPNTTPSVDAPWGRRIPAVQPCGYGDERRSDKGSTQIWPPSSTPPTLAPQSANMRRPFENLPQQTDPGPRVTHHTGLAKDRYAYRVKVRARAQPRVAKQRTDTYHAPLKWRPAATGP